MGIEQGFNLLQNVIGRPDVAGASLIMQLGIIIIALIIITRRVDKWAELSFPVAVGFHIIGIKMSYLILLVSGMLFVIETSSMTIIGNVIGSGLGESMKGIGKMFTRKGREKIKLERTISKAKEEAKMWKGISKEDKKRITNVEGKDTIENMRKGLAKIEYEDELKKLGYKTEEEKKKKWGINE